MAEIGSFALLLALALSVYSFVAGIIALAFQNRGSLQPAGATAGRAGLPASWADSPLLTALRQGSERIGETARRAGIATFAAVLLASVVLVICAFRDDFSIAYILHHSNRDLPGPYKFAVLWSGQEGSLLFWSLLLAAYGFVLRCATKRTRALRLRLGGSFRRADLSFFCCSISRRILSPSCKAPFPPTATA
jgi:cytochrome c-type biogenesis protein CcmF